LATAAEFAQQIAEATHAALAAWSCVLGTALNAAHYLTEEVAEAAHSARLSTTLRLRRGSRAFYQRFEKAFSVKHQTSSVG
jgi:hypothetical protein